MITSSRECVVRERLKFYFPYHYTLLFLHITCADNAHHGLLSEADVVKQSDVCRTGELATTTLNTTYNIVLLHSLPSLLLRLLCQEIWLQAHRASLNTLGALDTSRRLATLCLFAADNRDARATLHYRGGEV